MDRSELTDEEYEERKRRVVLTQNKKRFSSKFVLLSNIFLIIETAAIIFGLMVGIIAIFSHVNLSSLGMAMLFEIVKMIGFIGGLLLGFFIFRKVINFIIRKYNLEDKLTDNVKKHYMKKTRTQREQELRR